MSRNFAKSLVPIIAILAVFSIPVLTILQPILSDLVPLAYIITVFCLGTVCCRYLLSYHHNLKMEEIDKQAELARLDAERYRAAERLVDGSDPLDEKVREIERKSSSNEHE